ncbi:lipase 3-like isoform X1 [Sitodiplosis mosellana]|nr:lipase 3-like isoform X1 [Sitodiplosis mosellana]
MGNIMKGATATKMSFSSDKLIKFVPDRIKSEGYPAEVHTVVTDDEYILQLHRIPYGKISPKSNKPRPPVYLMHAFMESSNGWIVLGPENSLAYLLADEGYDVWLGNARGTEPSRRHLKLNPNGWRQKEYWSFSWHEIGVFDLPASIDYILNETKFEKLNYIGWSQGSTSFFVMASMRPEYNDKIIEANLLAPVAALKGTRNPFYNSFANSYSAINKLQMLRMYKIILNNDALLKIAETVCKDVVDSTPAKCKLILTALNSNQVNCTSLPSILVGTPSGASLKQGLHYLQLIRNGGFRQFDYESKKINQEVYGRDTPPEYDLARVTAPINLFHSIDDDTAVHENVIQLQSKLPNVKSRHVIQVRDFGHVDFAYSRYARVGLNDKLISTINEANRNN